MADGIAGLREQAARSAGGCLEVVRALEDGSFVVAHGRTGLGVEGELFFGAFRFKNDLVVGQ